MSETFLAGMFRDFPGAWGSLRQIHCGTALNFVRLAEGSVAHRGRPAAMTLAPRALRQKQEATSAPPGLLKQAACGLVRPGQWERNLLKVSPPHPLFQRLFTAAHASRARPSRLRSWRPAIQTGLRRSWLGFPRAPRWARSNREYTTVHPWKRHSQGSRRTPRIGARASCFSLSRSEFSFRLAACCNKPGARPATVGNGAFPA